MADDQQVPPSPQAEPAKQTDRAEKANKEESGEKPRGDRNLGGGPKYDIENSGLIGEQYTGDGHIHYHQHTTVVYNGVREATKGGSDVPEDLGRQQDQENKKAPNHKNPLANRHTDNTPNAAPVPVPQTKEELANWYKNLSSYSQCFVQAMAIFEGATIPEIAFATNRFYEPIAQEAKERAMKQPASVEILRKLEAPDGIQFEDRLQQTYVKVDRSGQNSYLMWQDNDKGLSSLRLHLLRFLAHASPWHDSDFLERLEAWTQSLDDEDENSSRALWTQGVIWWSQDTNMLRRVADEYSDGEQWYRASYLLYGAYSSHRFENESEANDRHKSIILHHVYKWSQQARKKSNSTKGCAAALTYMLIGSHCLSIALNGLDHLLELPWDPSKPLHEVEKPDDDDGEDEGDFADIYEGVVLSYYTLAYLGYTREILQHIAQRVEKDSHHRLALTSMKYDERKYHRGQRAIRLIASLDIFFRIAQESLKNMNYKPWVEYDLSSPLPERVYLDNDDVHGREVILTGVLNATWRSQVCTLLCGALMEENIGDFHTPALKLVREWADFVLKDQGPHPDKVRQSYVQFLVELGKTLQNWGRYWNDVGYHAPSATVVYKRRIQQWGRDAQPKKRAIARALADEVVLQLPF